LFTESQEYLLAGQTAVQTYPPVDVKQRDNPAAQPQSQGVYPLVPHNDPAGGHCEQNWVWVPPTATQFPPTT